MNKFRIRIGKYKKKCENTMNIKNIVKPIPIQVGHPDTFKSKENI